MTADGERQARAALTRLVEPGSEELGALVECMGAVEALGRIRDGRLAASPALVSKAQSRLLTLDVDRDLAILDAAGGRLVCPGDDEWPVGVDALGPLRPLALWLRGGGHLGSLAERAVAIVGSRASTDYGARISTGLAADLAERGWTVVSGGAYGIDAAAHEGALAAAGPTVAVLACGVDVPYPRGHHTLFAAVRQQGLLVSELPPGSAPFRGRFLTRNRLIAALASGTVVVEAAIRSGARRTATDTRALGRHLMAVPGPVTSPMSAGCHALLRDDDPAVLVTCAAEVLDLVGEIGADLAPLVRGPVHPRDELPPTVAQVLDALPARRAQGPARIAIAAGLPLGVVEPALGQLALLGLAELGSEGWRVSRPEPNT